jgi:hypothetical protein
VLVVDQNLRRRTNSLRDAIRGCWPNHASHRAWCRAPVRRGDGPFTRTPRASGWRRAG